MASRLRRLLPPLALLAGLFLFGVSLVVIGIEASGTDPQVLEPSALTAHNGTALLAFPTKYWGEVSGRVEVAYTFPAAPGDALVVDCHDYRALLQGERVAPLLAFTGLREGSFVVNYQTLPSEARYIMVVDPDTNARRFCDTYVAFQWAAGEDAAANRPLATVTYTVDAFDAGRSSLVLLILTASSLLALLGGLAWARASTRQGAPPGNKSALEMLRASLDRMGEQLQQTRHHLLLAGVFGIFLWYPVLVPWVWRQAVRTDVSAAFPWLVTALTVLFLVVVSGLWARQLRRLDREIIAWRTRMGQLREREASLLDTIDQDR